MKKAINRTLPIGLALLLVLLFLPWSMLSVQGAETASIEVKVTYDQSEARAMLDYINKFRAGKDVDGQKADYWNEDNKTKTNMTGKLSPLTYDYDLERTAMLRAAEIAMSFSHTRPDGSICFSAWSDDWYGAGENIAAGRTTAKATFVDWREDDEDFYGQGHRRNMLDSGFNRIGIGHVVYNGIHYWTQAFGYGTGDDTDPGVVNEEKLVSVDVEAGSMQDLTVTASPASYALQVGKAGALPSASASFLLADTWPGNSRIVTEVTPAWASSNNAVAKIENGKVTGVAAGSATLTAEVLGKTVKVPVTVTEDKPDVKPDDDPDVKPDDKPDVKPDDDPDVKPDDPDVKPDDKPDVKPDDDPDVKPDDPDPGFIKGDVNGDGAVNAKDLTTLAKHVANITLIKKSNLLKAADVNSDGAVNAKDLTHLARYVANIISKL